MPAPSDALAILDAYDRLVALCRDVAPPGTVEEAAAIGRDVRRRLGYLGDSLVVALAGGTGSGKTSLLNAIAGREVAPVSPRRPTTERPVAWLPADPEPGIVRLLDDLGITDRVGEGHRGWLTVVDLPDLDSFVTEHALQVDALLSRIDAVVWVFDPEKYQDGRIHLDYLASLVGDQHRFVFVLNQVDRLTTDEVEAVAADLRASLRVAGFVEPPIVLTAADPELGDPEGIDTLVAELETRWEAKTLVWRHATTVLRRSARALAAAAGADRGTGFAHRWQGTLADAAEHLATACLDPGRVGDWWRGVEEIQELVAAVAGEVGGEAGEELAAVDVAAEVRRCVAEVGVAPIPSKAATVTRWLRVVVASAALAVGLGVGGGVGWAVVGAVAVVGVWVVGPVVRTWDRRRIRDRMEERRAEVEARLRRQLDQEIGRRVRDVLRRRGSALAAFTEFELVLTRSETAGSPPPDRPVRI